MNNQQLDEERIFHIARKQPDRETQAEYLDQVCAGDQGLRERVEELLKVHNEERGFLKSNDQRLAATVDIRPGTEHPGATIGRYKLMEQIGEGGMGTVFVAQQDRPIRRKVALKVIKPGMDTKAVVARFEAERQALAMMDHPNIAKVLDAGTTESGRPYFAMELVKGVPITEYCDRNRLTIHERIILFIRVCHAIQHAHQKGIIHRDIKPSNVLVTLHDGNPVPKVIDFGVAKALNARLTDTTIYTEHLQIVGTLLYMSPEQAELSGLGVDTRCDIYSLGVLLYQLLTGTTPFQKNELEKAGFDEQRRIIRDKEPPRASVRISGLGKTATTVAEHRKTNPLKLNQSVRGDLDWIVLKSLEKDRTRRYTAASAFAEDLERFLGEQPVQARPPSTAYRLSKFAKRNRVAVSVGVFLIALVLSAMTAIALYADSAARSRDQARRALEREAVQHAVNQRHAGLEETLAAALEAGSDPLWENRVRGIAALFAGKFPEAKRLLLFCLDQGDESPAIHALLSELYMNMGKTDSALQHAKMAFATDPITSDDRLFRALLSYADPHGSDVTAEALFRKQKSPLALLVKSKATSWTAVAEHDLSMAEEGVSQAQIAMRFLPESDYAMIYYLEAICQAHRVAQRVGNLEKAEEFKELGRDVCSQIQKRGEFPRLSMVGRFLEQIGERTTAEAVYQAALKNAVDGWARFHYVDFLMEEQDYGTALNYLESQGQQESWIQWMHARALAEMRGREPEAIEMLKELVESDVPVPYQVMALSQLSILGEYEYARQQSQEIWNSDLDADRSAFPPFADILGVLAGELDAERVIEEASGKIDKGDVLYCLAAFAYGRREFDRAREYLDDYRLMEQRPGCMDIGPLLRRRIDARAARKSERSAKVQVPVQIK
ncbi:protein kinase [Stieleria sp. ICT_E10.1]|uniref:serine/threonine protein kinase n=1 Tax=Stieleria sedimenti TaxID=2976331 RepID=UPI00217F4980|nr:protein kinase [Stieleria sedimenti]MCS7471456.1 protein kinase [Stieleria sedimenti]